MKRIAAVIFLLLSIPPQTMSQTLSPSETVLNFYRALREKRYVEGFHFSIYRVAVEGLTAAELKDLEPDFARTFAEIPDKIEAKGEQINGDSAIVFLKFPGQDEVQQVGLIRQGKEWLVGDQESYAVVKRQGRAFFFNTRMEVNEAETVKMLSRIFSAEIIYAQKYEGRFMDMADMVRLQAVPGDLGDGESNGYKFTVTLAADKKSFMVSAVPAIYGKTGRSSFYLDADGLRADDKKGQPASKDSPTYHPKSE